MSMATKPRRIPQAAACIEGGATHAWERLGLDTKRGVLVNARRCVWCSKEQTTPYGGKGAWS